MRSSRGVKQNCLLFSYVHCLKHMCHILTKNGASYSALNYSIEMRLDKLSLYLIEKDTFYAF